MSRWQFVISEQNRSRVLEWIRRAPVGFRVDLKEAKRTTDQNDRMWAMITDVCRHHQRFGGRKHTPDQWKALFLHMAGRQVDFLPSLDGETVIPYGQSSSDLSRAEFSNVIEAIYHYGATQTPPVEWSEPQQVAA